MGPHTHTQSFKHNSLQAWIVACVRGDQRNRQLASSLSWAQIKSIRYLSFAWCKPVINRISRARPQTAPRPVLSLSADVYHTPTQPEESQTSRWSGTLSGSPRSAHTVKHLDFCPSTLLFRYFCNNCKCSLYKHCLRTNDATAMTVNIHGEYKMKQWNKLNPWLKHTYTINTFKLLIRWFID